MPRDAETCGPVIHDDESMVYVAVQHPGEDGTYGAHTSYFPDYVAAGATPKRGEVRAPRPTVVQMFPKDSGKGDGKDKGRDRDKGKGKH